MEKGCPSCGRMVDKEVSKCPYCNYDFTDLSNVINKYEKERLKEIKITKYAGFIKRMVATGLDLLIWTIIFNIISICYIYKKYQIQSLDNITNLAQNFIQDKMFIIIFLSTIFCYFLYCTFSHYSKKMATYGERLIGIEIVNENEQPVNFVQALSHNLFKILNIMTLGIGYLMIIITKKKQAISDILSKTYVINKITNEDYTKFRYSSPALRLLAYIIDISYLYLLFWIYKLLNSILISNNITYINIFITIINILFIIYILIYFPYMESKYGATLGKRILDIKVINLNGEKPSFIKSLIRLLLFTLDIIIPLGILLVFVMPRKQTLKDLITKTIVVNQS